MTAPAAAEFDREAAARRLMPIVCRMARSYAYGAGFARQADEYISQSLVGLGQAFAEFDPDKPMTLGAWAYRLGRQSLRNMTRNARWRLTRAVEIDGLDLTTIGGEGGAEAVDARLDAETVLGELSREELRLVRLLYWRGMTLGEAAAELGVSRYYAAQMRDEMCERLREIFA